MDSKEFGLVFGQQLTGMEDLHYGFWDETVPEISVLYMKQAQLRYTEQIIETIEAGVTGPQRIIDVGCGTGQVLVALSERGHQVDGVIPAPHLEARVREKVAAGSLNSTVWGCTLQDVPVETLTGQYDTVLFSESFQYIPYQAALAAANTLLKPGGQVVICDFFKTDNTGDGQPGDRSFGGGHPYSKFIKDLEASDWVVLENSDITANTSPNIHLLDLLLRERIGPAMGTLDHYLGERHGLILKSVKWLFRKKLAKLKFKYLSGHRSQAVFERYKTYRRIVLKKAT
ncbi:class I SAM-dependent methyltransferase [Saccharospirillum impatiens]|uniref:class I SAM-dependent methyltransferase n=1 Tax=Saccharospirillum impatiens TaxID=169438 RepID=UPI0003FAD845|nr:class I SAM-dependent methyltransferase [Saccharospirillum impatiens]